MISKLDVLESGSSYWRLTARELHGSEGSGQQGAIVDQRQVLAGKPLAAAPCQHQPQHPGDRSFVYSETKRTAMTMSTPHLH